MGTHYLVWLLFTGWWNAHRLARMIMFVVFWATLFDLRIGNPGDYSVDATTKVIACGVIAWLIAGLPVYLRVWNLAGFGARSTARPAPTTRVSPSGLPRLSR